MTLLFLKCVFSTLYDHIYDLFTACLSCIQGGFLCFKDIYSIIPSLLIVFVKDQNDTDQFPRFSCCNKNRYSGTKKFYIHTVTLINHLPLINSIIYRISRKRLIIWYYLIRLIIHRVYLEFLVLVSFLLIKAKDII